jgi:hypothetical protein
MLWVKTKANYLYYSEVHIKSVYHPSRIILNFLGKLKELNHSSVWHF